MYSKSVSITIIGLLIAIIAVSSSDVYASGGSKSIHLSVTQNGSPAAGMICEIVTSLGQTKFVQLGSHGTLHLSVDSTVTSVTVQCPSNTGIILGPFDLTKHTTKISITL